MWVCNFQKQFGFIYNESEKFGLYVNKELLKGCSYPSETFHNEVLSKENDFEIQFIEVLFLYIKYNSSFD